MSALLICRDCRWCRYPGVSGTACTHDAASAPSVNLVSGESGMPVIFCATMRAPTGPCGAEARLFEAREPT